MTGTHPSPHLLAADLAPMQHHADPLADETIAKILGPWPPGCVATDAPQWAHINTVNLLFSQWADNATLTHWQATEGPVQVGDSDKAAKGYVTAEMAEALNHYVQAAQVLPPWADARKIERA